MIRIHLVLTLVLSLLSVPFAANAADDGGFGAQRFTSKAPAALGDDPSSSAPALASGDAASLNPAEIEPAAGTDEGEDGEQQADKGIVEVEDAPSEVPAEQ